MANYDATNTNESNRTSRTFKDLDLDFGLNSVTKDVNKLTDAESIKRSVRNLINTNNYERPFHPEIGSGIRGLLFEPSTELTTHFMQQKIAEILNQYEPRIILTGVKVRADDNRNAYNCTISFLIVGSQEPVEVDTFLERLR
jgi:phage baseplate assembly protein W|tara:strand:+ start:23 stop:448 length:426 start_codon:yes stop_codon:yes gene_type:complete